MCTCFVYNMSQGFCGADKGKVGGGREEEDGKTIEKGRAAAAESIPECNI